MVRVGLIGLDMSHAVAFTAMLNDPAHPHHVPGGRVTVGYAGGSDDFELSRSRLDGYVRQVRDGGVRVVASPADVAAEADVVLITAVDGRQHRPLFEAVAPHRKPTFVGKPLALSGDDAAAMFDLADRHGTVLMSSSALRFSDAFTTTAGDGQGIVGVDVFGPAPLEQTQPGLFWYGIHAVEMVVAAMGVGCVEASATATDAAETVTLRWGDGRVATVRGLRAASSAFGLTVHRAAGPSYADTTGSATPTAAGLLRAIMASLPRGVSAVPAAETLAVVRIVEAANRSRAAGGRPMAVG